MPFPILELPAILASIALQSPATAAPHRCGTHPLTVADCCVHFAARGSAAFIALSPRPSAQIISADERITGDVDAR